MQNNNLMQDNTLLGILGGMKKRGFFDGRTEPTKSLDSEDPEESNPILKLSSYNKDYSDPYTLDNALDRRIPGYIKGKEKAEKNMPDYKLIEEFLPLVDKSEPTLLTSLSDFFNKRT